MNVKPLADRILVRRLEQKEEVRGGIIIPDTAKEKPTEAEVVAVGPGKVTKDGKRISLEIEKRRPRSSRQVFRNGSEDRRRRLCHPARGGRTRDFLEEVVEERNARKTAEIS